MTNEELLAEVKKGLGMPTLVTALDGGLTQKLLMVKSFLMGAGVSTEILEDDLAVGVIVLGVTDLWKLDGGEVKFSPVFYTLAGQLTASSSLLTMATSPANGAASVAVSVEPVLTFGKRLSSYSVQLMEYDSQDDVSVDLETDITKKIITVTPSSNLTAGTKYGLVIKATAVDGVTLDRTVVSFTTAG